MLALSSCMGWLFLGTIGGTGINKFVLAINEWKRASPTIAQLHIVIVLLCFGLLLPCWAKYDWVNYLRQVAAFYIHTNLLTAFFVSKYKHYIMEYPLLQKEKKGGGIDVYGVLEEMPVKALQVIGKLQFLAIQYPLFDCITCQRNKFPNESCAGFR